MGLADVYPRALELHGMIKAGQPVNAAYLVDRFEISHRHALRIVEYLRDRLKAPVIYDRRRGTYCYTEPLFELPAIVMTEGEAVGMLVAHEALLRRQGSPLGRHLKRAIEKLRSLLPRSVSVDIESLMSHVTFSPIPSRTVSDNLLDAVTRALESRQTLFIEYYSASGNETSQRDVDLYHLTHLRGDWYAVAWCHLRKALRTFALSRIKRTEMRSTLRYSVPPSFSIEAYFKNALGVQFDGSPQRVLLHFDADQARWVRERVWHPTQQIVERADGGLNLALEVTLSMELCQWILSYGRHVKVLEPEALAADIEVEHAAALAMYRSL